MKTKLLLTAILMVILAGFFNNVESRPGNAYFGYFYDNLRGHGQWIVLNDDLIVWKPYRVRADWAPYKRGTWVWSNYGWYWSSYEPFGYIVYHYGRWYYDDYYGWIWIPDYEWAPAWVEWRYDNDYIGWAPLPPYVRFRPGYGIYYSFNFSINYIHFHFVSYRNFCSANMENYYVPSQYKYRIYNNTRREDGSIYYDNGIRNRGVDRNFVEKRSGRSFSQRDLVFNNNDDRGRGNNERINVERIDFSRERIINPAELNLERGRNRSSLQTERVEIGERRSALTGERESKPEVRREREIIENDNTREAVKSEGRRIENRKDDRYMLIQQERNTEVSKEEERKAPVREELRSTIYEPRNKDYQVPVKNERNKNEMVAPQRETNDSRRSAEIRARGSDPAPSPVVRQRDAGWTEERRATTKEEERRTSSGRERERR